MVSRIRRSFLCAAVAATVTLPFGAAASGFELGARQAAVTTDQAAQSPAAATASPTRDASRVAEPDSSVSPTADSSTGSTTDPVSDPSGDEDLDRQADRLSVDGLSLSGGSVKDGAVVIANTAPFRARVVGVDTDATGTMRYPLLRTVSPAAAHVLGDGPTTMSAFLDVLGAARAMYPNASVTHRGEPFESYSDYLLYYFRNDLGGKNTRDYPDLTDLKDLTPSDIGQVFTGDYSFRESGRTLDFDLPSESDLPVPHRQVADGGVALVETDPAVNELGDHLMFAHTLYFTLDTALAPQGRLPTSVGDLEKDDYTGLAFDAYASGTVANQAETSRMVDGLVLDPGESHLFTRASLSTVDGYLASAYVGNAIDFHASFKLRLTPVGIDGFVYRDVNGNGSFDPAEPVEPGVKVVLVEQGGRGEMASATTNDAGYYAFAQGGPGGRGTGEVPDGFAVVQFDAAKRYRIEFAPPGAGSTPLTDDATAPGARVGRPVDPVDQPQDPAVQPEDPPAASRGATTSGSTARVVSDTSVGRNDNVRANAPLPAGDAASGQAASNASAPADASADRSLPWTGAVVVVASLSIAGAGTAIAARRWRACG